MSTRLVLAAVLVVGVAVAADQPAELRVCADPDNLPFSNQRLEGFENEIAKIIAKDLNASVRYTWLPQRGAFLDRTLMAHRCDVLMNVPSGYDAVLATKPYYTSSYVFVYAKNRGLELRSFDDPVLRKLRIGLQAFGEDGANAPPVHALARRGIVHNIAAFPLLGDDKNPPAKIIDAVAAGEIDVAIVWGPFGGYYARRQPMPLEVRPVSPSVDRPMLPFTFDMSMGVRPGETAFKQKLEGPWIAHAMKSGRSWRPMAFPSSAAPIWIHPHPIPTVVRKGDNHASEAERFRSRSYRGSADVSNRIDVKRSYRRRDRCCEQLRFEPLGRRSH